MRTIRHLITASVTTSLATAALAALLVSDAAARGAEDFASGWKTGLE